MRRQTRGMALLLAALAMGTLPGWTKPDSSPLPRILAGLDRASRLYLDTALRFTCDETITEPDADPRLEETFQYIFVHERDGSLRDYRMAKGEGGRPELDPKTRGFHHFMRRAYLWVLVFHASRQRFFRYELLDKGRLPTEGTVQVRFAPIPPYHEAVNDWFGIAWVDVQSFQIVRVEAQKAESHESAKRMQRDAESLGAGITMAREVYEVQTVTSDFGKTKNGMRFPSRTRIVSSVYALPGTVFLQRPDLVTTEHTYQTYRRYKFYSVRTKDEIRDLLNPVAGPGSETLPGGSEQRKDADPLPDLHPLPVRGEDEQGIGGGVSGEIGRAGEGEGQNVPRVSPLIDPSGQIGRAAGMLGEFAIENGFHLQSVWMGETLHLAQSGGGQHGEDDEARRRVSG